MIRKFTSVLIFVFSLILVAATIAKCEKTTSPDAKFVIPAEIDATGKEEVSGAINDFLASVPDGSQVEFRTNAIYRCDQPLLLKGRQNLEIDGKGALLVPGQQAAGKNPSGLIDINDCSNVIIKYLHIQGAFTLNYKSEEKTQNSRLADYGISIENSSNLQFEFLRIENVRNEYLRINAGASQTANRSNNIQIKRCIFQWAGVPGLSVRAVNSVLFEQNYLDIDMAQLDGKLSDVDQLTFRSNTFSKRFEGSSRNRGLDSTVPSVELDNNLSINGWPALASPEFSVRARSTQSKTIELSDDIDRTGSRDVTNLLNKFLADLPEGAYVLFPEGGTFLCEGTIRFSNKRNLTIEGNGSQIIAKTIGMDFAPPGKKPKNWPRNRSHFSLVNSSGITIQNLFVLGPHQEGGTGKEAYDVSLEAQHGFNILSSQDITIQNVRIEQVFGDFIYIGKESGKSNVLSQNITIRNSVFNTNGRQGVGITAGQKILIEGNYFGNIRRSCIDLEPNSSKGGARDVTIRSNTFGPGRLMWVASKGKGGNVGNLLVENNLLIGKSPNIQIGQKDYRRGPITLLNNFGTGMTGNPNGVAWKFRNIDGIRASGNYFPMQKGRDMALVGPVNCTDVQVDGNVLPNAIDEVGKWTYLSEKKKDNSRKSGKKN